MSEGGPESRQPNPLHAYSFATQIVSELALPPLVGVWLDNRYGWQPWGVLSGAVFGVVLVVYRLIRWSDKSR